MSTAVKCRAKGGVESCKDPNCPEKRAASFVDVLDGRERAQRRSFFASLGSLFAGKRQPPQANNVHVETLSAAQVEKIFAAQDAKVVKAPVVRGTLNVVSRRADGRLEVLAEDEVSKGGQDVYPFGDLITDPVVAQQLHDADPNKQYQNGECGALAFELWNSNPHVAEYYVLAVDGEPVYGIHQFVRLTDGSYADSMGVWSEQALTAYWRDIDASVKLQVFDDGEPEPARNQKIKVSNQKLFDAISDVIAVHFKA